MVFFAIAVGGIIGSAILFGGTLLVRRGLGVRMPQALDESIGAAKLLVVGRLWPLV